MFGKPEVCFARDAEEQRNFLHSTVMPEGVVSNRAERAKGRILLDSERGSVLIIWAQKKQQSLNGGHRAIPSNNFEHPKAHRWPTCL